MRIIVRFRRLGVVTHQCCASSHRTNNSDFIPTGVYHVKYLVYLAIARLVLLLLPLLFHSYTGTALRFQLLYMLLYWGTLAILVVHTVSLTLMNPESLEALIPIDASNISTAFLHELRRIWWMLSLSIVSDISHLIILMHVRSTAPTHPLLTGSKRPPSVYYTLRSQNLSNGRDEEPMLMNAMTGTSSFLSISAALSRPWWSQFSHSHSPLLH